MPEEANPVQEEVTPEETGKMWGGLKKAWTSFRIARAEKNASAQETAVKVMKDLATKLGLVPIQPEVKATLMAEAARELSEQSGHRVTPDEFHEWYHDKPTKVQGALLRRLGFGLESLTKMAEPTKGELAKAKMRFASFKTKDDPIQHIDLRTAKITNARKLNAWYHVLLKAGKKFKSCAEVAKKKLKRMDMTPSK